MPTIWFIRHGESESNANLPTTHPAESGLTPKGWDEANAIVGSFSTTPSLIVVSPYLRAKQTAKPTIDHFDSVPQEEWPVYEFTYLDPIRYLNTTITDRQPYALEYWRRNDPEYKDGGVGESFTELMDRVKETLARSRGHPAEFIAVFSHGLFLRALGWSLLTGKCDGSPDTMQRYRHFVQSVWMPNGAMLKTRFASNGEVFWSGLDITHLPREELSEVRR